MSHHSEGRQKHTQTHTHKRKKTKEKPKENENKGGKKIKETRKKEEMSPQPLCSHPPWTWEAAVDRALLR
jgi:DNA-binding transcriptional regulator YiaG